MCIRDSSKTAVFTAPKIRKFPINQAIVTLGPFFLNWSKFGLRLMGNPSYKVRFGGLRLWRRFMFRPSFVQYVKKRESVDFCVQGIAAGLPLQLRPDLMLPNNCHCPLSTGGRQITMPMHQCKTQIESPEAKCPRFALQSDEECEAGRYVSLSLIHI